MSQTFVCEGCDAELEAGLSACPRCGQAFDTPVPGAVIYREATPDETAPAPSARPAAPALVAAPDPMPVPFPKMPPPDRNGLSVGLFLTLIVLACLFWLAENGAFRPGGGYLPSPAAPVAGR